MANTDNKCSNLVIKTMESKSLDLIFKKQEELQERLGFNFDNMNLKETAEFWMFNKHAIEDEFSEMFDALGGINHGIGNAVWKKWKRHHNKAEYKSVKDLTHEDMLELKFEITDAFHLFVNFAISIGMTGSELYSMYIAKNQENHRRQEDGY